MLHRCFLKPDMDMSFMANVHRRGAPLHATFSFQPVWERTALLEWQEKQKMRASWQCGSLKALAAECLPPKYKACWWQSQSCQWVPQEVYPTACWWQPHSCLCSRFTMSIHNYVFGSWCCESLVLFIIMRHETWLYAHESKLVSTCVKCLTCP